MIVNGYKIGKYANLEGVNLECANLEGVNLEYANLEGVNLRYANLKGANLKGANLERANLKGANLEGVNLECANLQGASLQGVNLEYANLEGVNLKDVNLKGANLEGVNLPDSLAIPDGDLIGYKKLQGGVICKLAIPANAKRFKATTQKHRAEFAEVLSLSGGAVKGVSLYDPHFVYRIGEVVKPTQNFNPDRWNECSSGIHFFLTEEEAKNY